MRGRVEGLEIVWRAFELRPEPVPTLDPRGDYLKNAWEHSVYPLAERLGVTMRLPPVQPRSRLAHRAAAWARARGRFEAIHRAIFRAFFERGEDIGRTEVLADLAQGVGLDGEALLDLLAGEEYVEDVLADERLAERYGIRGVPAFVSGGQGLVGVQPAERLEALVQETHAP